MAARGGGGGRRAALWRASWWVHNIKNIAKTSSGPRIEETIASDPPAFSLSLERDTLLPYHREERERDKNGAPFFPRWQIFPKNEALSGVPHSRFLLKEP